MKIGEMMRHYHRPEDHTHSPEIPIVMEVKFPPTLKPKSMIDAVREIKATGWYRSLKRTHLYFTPIGSKERVIFIAIGTAAALGTAYTVYQATKEHSKKHNI